MSHDLEKKQSQAALLVIDVQRELFTKSIPIYRAETLLRNINTLVERAHQAGALVFYIQHSSKKILVKGTDGWQLHPDLQPLATDRIIHKHHSNAFKDTSLAEGLNAGNVGTVVVAGLVTHGCVKATCLGAKELGYRVVLVEDGHSSYHKQADKVIEEWNAKLSKESIEVKSTQEIDFVAGL
ncbi:MAG: cysteine hydrolase family protein [Anaerolineae bacterium]|jgi:nicotinamidase-related amidase